MKKMLIIILFTTSILSAQGLIIPSDTKIKVPQKQVKKKALSSSHKKSAKSSYKKKSGYTAKKTSTKKSYPIEMSKIEKVLLNLQQQIAIEKKKNELLKLQKENKKIEKEIGDIEKPAVSTPVSQPPEKPYSYIAGRREIDFSSQGEFEVVGIAGDTAVVRSGRKYFYLTEGMEFKNWQVVKILSNKVIFRRNGKEKVVGLSYTPVISSQQIVERQEEEKK